MTRYWPMSATEASMTAVGPSSVETFAASCDLAGDGTLSIDSMCNSDDDLLLYKPTRFNVGFGRGR